MRDVDRIATEEYGLHLLQMMENAGRHFAALAREYGTGEPDGGHSVLVVCGRGGNGGGGLVAARRLHGWGVPVTVATAIPPDEYEGVPAHQLALARRLAVPIVDIAGDTDLPDAALILDALIGCGLRGDLREEMAHVIHKVVWHGAPVVSLDVPSGLDATTGVPSKTTVHAEGTVTLALPKCGLDAPAAHSAVGDLYLADIGIPPGIYDEVDVNGDVQGLFAQNDRIQLR